MNKLIGVIVAILILFLGGFQIVRLFIFPVKTQTAIAYTHEEVVEGKGLIVREEIAIEGEYTGMKSTVYQSGIKVKSGETVASFYQNESDIISFIKADEIQEEIDALNKMKENSSYSGQQPELIKKQIDNQIVKLVSSVKSKTTQNLSQEKFEYVSQITNRQYATNKTPNIDERIATLESMKENLLSSITSEPTLVNAPTSGVYSKETDGFESVYNSVFLETAKVADIEEAVNKDYNAIETSAGKIINQFNWKIAIVADASIKDNVKIGNSVKVTFPFTKNKVVTATISRFEIDADNPEKALLILSCDYMSDEIASARNPRISVEIKTYSGIKINKEGLRVENEQQGVYVYYTKQAKFKTVEPIYIGSDFFIAKIDTTNKDNIQVYDEVIVEGSELYDGKRFK